MGHREFLTWEAYLDDEDMNSPSRTDHYLMQIAQEIRAANRAPNTQPPGLDKFKIRFKLVKVVPKKTLSPEEAKAQRAAHKAAWLGALGVDPGGKDGR